MAEDIKNAEITTTPGITNQGLISNISGTLEKIRKFSNEPAVQRSIPVMITLFVIFIGILIYFKVPIIIIGLLDKRSISIRSEIDEANKLLEEAKSLLAKSEREHKENILKANEIISSAEKTSKQLLEQSKSDIKLAVSRKLENAKKQIETNEKSVLNSIKTEIVESAFLIAEKSLVSKLDKTKLNKINKQSIDEISNKLI